MTYDRVENPNLRTVLRGATADAHAHLDRAIGALELADPAQYATFLQIQLAARRPIEAWCAANCPPELAPPSQSAALVRDLAALGRRSFAGHARFAAPANADPIGAAWALGGSSMGNRAMLAHLRKRAGFSLPTEFLGDPAMPAFFRDLLPRLERAPADRGAGGVAAAHAVFACFQAAADAFLVRQAA